MQAIEAVKKVDSKKEPVIGIAETNDMFILALDNDDEAYKTVNKNTGDIGSIWIWDYMDLTDRKDFKKLNIDEVRRAS